MSQRIAQVCIVCHSVTWVQREGLVLNALIGSRMWHSCPICTEAMG